MVAEQAALATVAPARSKTETIEIIFVRNTDSDGHEFYTRMQAVESSGFLKWSLGAVRRRGQWRK